MRKTPHIIGWLTLITLSVSATLCPASEELRVTLHASDESGAFAPFLPAELALQATASGPHQVNIQDTQGGPIYQYPVNLSANQLATFTAYLPPLAPSQTYRIWLDTELPEPNMSILAELNWPAEKVRPEIFFDSGAYAPFRYDLPTWPESMPWRVLFLGVVLCLLLWAILLIRSRRWRGFCFLLILLAAGAYMVFSSHPEVLIQETHNDLWVLRARRSCQFESNDLQLVPLYATKNQFAKDQTIIRFTSRPSMQTVVEPEQVKIFRVAYSTNYTPTTQTQPEPDSNR